MKSRRHTAVAIRPRHARPPDAPKERPTHDERAAKIIRDVLAEGTWRELLPLPIDGLVLAASRSVEYASHEVRIQGRAAVSCSGLCGIPREDGERPFCWHRCQVALALWQDEHPGWDVTAVRDEATGEPRTALVHTLIDAYLTPARRPFVKWWLSPADGPETAHTDRATALA